MKALRISLYHAIQTLALVCLFGIPCPARSQEKAPAPSAGAAGVVNFSFDQVEIRVLVKLMGEITGRRFVVDDAVKGQVTVMAPRIPTTEAYRFFLKILESAGCSVVDEGNVIRVVALPPRATPVAPVVGPGVPVPAEGYVTKVIRLQNTMAADIKKALDALTGREKATQIVAVEASNHLIITDTADAIRRFEQIIAEFDRPGAGIVSEVIFPKHIDAAEFVRQYMAAAGAGEKFVREGVPLKPGRNLMLLSSPASNAIVMIGSPSEIGEIRKILGLIDVESASGKGSLHAIFLKYAAAEEAAKSLNGLLEKSLGKDTKPGERRRISIEASPANNALLVDASAMDFELVRSLVEQLDRTPQQVLIEVVIAEISVDNELDLGVELAAMNAPAKVGDTVVAGSTRLNENADSLMTAIQNGVFPRGITIGVAQGLRLDADGKVVAGYPGAINVNALQRNGRVRILSSVPLLAQNNKEASVSVVNNVPVLKSTIQGGSGTARDVIQNIDRVDVGIKLKLTPHINPDNEVCMVLNPSIEAIIDPGPSGSQFTPTIAKREVSTTVTVPDNRTIVISGLIREDRTLVVRKIPLLGSIPLLGFLFRDTVDGTKRTNLIIFVTPHVVGSAQASEAVTGEWSRRTGLSSTNVPDATPVTFPRRD